MRGAGGTSGGTGQFFIGFVMLVGGFYLLLRSINVTAGLGLGMHLFGIGNYHVTGGMVLIPFIIGIGLIFYNSKNLIGWALSVASLVMLIFGVIASIKFTIRHMNAFEVLMILILCFGGLGLFLRSLKTQ
ncbi:MAG: hypothetical protein ACLFOY_13485 [Desulfatibacillaceae bacterium]